MAILSACVLLLTAKAQIYDTNFQTLWEGTALLLGDHPYRDFYEWGLPLQAVVSALAQLAVGYRLIGEFLMQWLLIIASVVIALHLALRASRSTAATAAAMLPVVVLLAVTATYHYPKLFLYPLGLWAAWQYLERPGPRRAIVLAIVTALAFLFRHDHGAFIGGLAALTLAASGAAAWSWAHWRSVVRDTLIYGAVLILALAPWLVIVQRSEGLVEYVRVRSTLYVSWSASDSPYRSLLAMHPLRLLTGEKETPAPASAVVHFEWRPAVGSEHREAIERRFGLALVERVNDREWAYRVPNVFDVSLLGLREYIDNASGFEWDRLDELSSRLPTHADALRWMEQLTLLVPILVIGTAALEIRRSRIRRETPPMLVYQLLVAAVFLAAINSRLLREPGYFQVVMPVTAVLAARLIAGRRPEIEGAPTSPLPWRLIRWTLVTVTLAVTALCVFVLTVGTQIFTPWRLGEDVASAVQQLLASPPIDGYMPAAQAMEIELDPFARGEAGDRLPVLLRYVHDCTQPGDRLLVTGSTPYQVSYYAEHSIAGGHLFWHHGWRSDPAKEAWSLAMLHRQAVPFAISTTERLLDDFAGYPHIRDFLRANYAEIPGSEGKVLFDTRRPPTGRFGKLGYPCFR